MKIPQFPLRILQFARTLGKAQRPLETAHGALVGVSSQHLLSEPGTPQAPPGRCDGRAGRQLQHREVQAHRITDHRGQARREVQVQQQPRRGRQRARIRQQLLSPRAQAARCPTPGQPRPALRGIRTDLCPEPSRRSQISRSRWTNGIAARCRPAEALATGGPKSLISALTGSAASVYAARVLPVEANLPNSHSSNSGLCGARRRARPTGAHRSRADRTLRVRSLLNRQP